MRHSAQAEPIDLCLRHDCHEQFMKSGHSFCFLSKPRKEQLMQAETQLCMSTEADCNAALKINPDSGKAYRVRGKACVCCSIIRLMKVAALKHVEGGPHPAATEIDQYAQRLC